MKVSLNWLRELVELPDNVPALVEVLTMAGVEVEKHSRRGIPFGHVVVAQIRESIPHPNADRLSVCQVDDGSGTARQIVCGAKNYKVGDKVPLALPGAVLPGDFRIKVGKLRGVESQGMLCSSKELTIAEDAEGLLILPSSARVGTPLAELYPEDNILDLEITPNRSDLLSHYGLAREIAALTKSKLTPPRCRKAELNFAHTVEIAADECPFYTARYITGVKVGPSPDWLRERLEAIGLRPINNIVDITNFVMFEMGQPLHAFDAAKLGGDIRVRTAQVHEQFPALDGRSYTLAPEHLVIADARRAIAIAGVMGGEETAVTQSTSAIWLESAYFQPASVRRTSRTLGLMSDSSYRFERDVDPAGVLVASQRAAELIAELAGGEAGELRLGFAANSQFGFDAQGIVDGIEYAGSIALRPQRCADLLGIDISEEIIDATLRGFGLMKEAAGWLVPSYRQDLTREVDLIEEVARIVGIDAIPSCDLARFMPSAPADQAHDRLMEMRRGLTAQGVFEARTLTLISPKALREAFFAGEPQRIRNPLTEEQSVLRPSLLPGLLEALPRNVRAGSKAVRLFEIGRVFSPSESDSADSTKERTHLGLLLSGSSPQSAWRGGGAQEADLFELKGILQAVLDHKLTFHPITHPDLGIAASVELNGEKIGHIGQLWPASARALDATAAVVFAEIDLSMFLETPAKVKRFRSLSRYPSVVRDIAMIAPLGLAHEQIVTALRAANEQLLADVELFDVFTDSSGARVPGDRKSLAYSLTYRAPDRTLTADEVNASHSRLKERLRNELGVTLRE